MINGSIRVLQQNHLFVLYGAEETCKSQSLSVTELVDLGVSPSVTASQLGC